MTRLRRFKLALGGAGMVIGLAGMAGQREVLVYVAVALLAAAIALRLVERKRLASFPPPPD